jgi:hypothetical protein
MLSFLGNAELAMLSVSLGIDCTGGGLERNLSPPFSRIPSFAIK